MAYDYQDYYELKAAKKSASSGQTVTADEIKENIASSGLTPQQHYETYGKSENIVWSAYEAIQEQYQTLFGRVGEEAGVEHWLSTGLANSGDNSLKDNMINAATENGFSLDTSSGIYQKPGFEWNADAGEYTPISGYTPPGDTPPGSGLLDDLPDIFQPDLIPTSDSSSATHSNQTSENQSTNESSSSSASGSEQQSTSETGIDKSFTDPLLKGLLPTLQESIKDLPGQVDQWADKNLAASRSASKNLLDGHLTNMLADLSKRGMVGGSVASQGLGQAGVGAAQQQAGIDLGIRSQANQQRLQIPGILQGIAGLGHRSDAQSTGSSFSNAQSQSSGQSTGWSSGQSTGWSSGQSTGTSSGESSGISSGSSTNPLAPYELYSKLLMGMM